LTASGSWICQRRSRAHTVRLLLADLGAEVIRIENIHNGDQTRLLPYLFNALNRNKKSIALNLKTKEAGEIFYKMSKDADVILEGFVPEYARSSALITIQSRPSIIG